MTCAAVAPRYIAVEGPIGAEYETFFHGYRAAPALFVDTTTVNYLDNGGHYADLLAQLDGEISGTRAFCSSSQSIISLIAEDTHRGI